MDYLYKDIGNYRYNPQATLLGKGTFGEVFLGEYIEDSEKKVAIKFISAATLEAYKDNLKLFLREVDILKKIKGNHLLELKEAIQSSSGNLYLVTNYCNGGNLETLLYNEKKLKVETALKYLHQIAEAFEELAQLEITDEAFGRKLTLMHRDIKPSNLLLQNGEIVVADFGFSKFAVENERGIKRDHTKLGTPSYMAPQLLALGDYSYKCDIWSTGIVIYELIFGEKPWKGATEYGLLEKIKTQPLKFPETIPPEVENVLSRMLTYDEVKRISWKELLKHPALNLSKKPDPQNEQNQPILQNQQDQPILANKQDQPILQNQQDQPVLQNQQKQPLMAGRIQIISQEKVDPNDPSNNNQDSKPEKKSKIKIIE